LLKPLQRLFISDESSTRWTRWKQTSV